jgi:predicted phage gp36 major capsid-like protein
VNADLQERAREIAAGLTRAQRRLVMAVADAGNAYFLYGAEWRLATRELAGLLTRSSVRPSDNRYCVPTDIGRAVAAVLAEGGAR